MGAPAVSVIVPARNRRGELRGLLRALARQTLPPGRFEAIVIDDGSSDGTGEMLEAWPRGGLALRSVRLPRAGPGAARNAGARLARGEVLAFTDSDCEPLPGWVGAFARAFADPGLILAGGPEEFHPDDGIFARCSWVAMNSPIATGGIRGRAGWTAARYRPRSFNMAIRREAFLKSGGFLEAWFPGEDIELSGRLQRMGAAAVFVPEARVRHHKRPTPRAFGSQILIFGRTRVRLAVYERMPPPLACLLPAAWLIAAAGALVSAAARGGSRWPAIFLASTAAFGAAIGVEACWRLGTPAAFLPGAGAALLQIGAYGAGVLSGLTALWRARGGSS